MGLKAKVAPPPHTSFTAPLRVHNMRLILVSPPTPPPAPSPQPPYPFCLCPFWMLSLSAPSPCPSPLPLPRLSTTFLSPPCFSLCPLFSFGICRGLWD